MSYNSLTKLFISKNVNDSQGIALEVRGEVRFQPYFTRKPDVVTSITLVDIIGGQVYGRIYFAGGPMSPGDLNKNMDAVMANPDMYKGKSLGASNQ